jgi:phenylacetate-CoA ligase
MNSWLAGRTYYLLQGFRGEPVRRAVEDLCRTEFVSAEEQGELQAKRQLEQLRFAVQHVPWYRAAYAPFVSRIKHAKSRDDVAEIMEMLPVLEKETVTGQFEQFKADNLSELKTYPDKTSGSSGSPLMFPCDQRAWAYRHALQIRCQESFGVKVGDPYALFFGLHWNRRSRLQVKIRDFVFNRVRISAFDIQAKNLESDLNKIRSHRPVYFLGYPSAIYEFCFLLRERGWDLKDSGLKLVVLTAEPLHAYQRELITEITNAPCLNLYGSAEGGLDAFECPQGSLHITPEATWLQLRESGREAGEAVVTDMMLRAFPLIRYAIGDEVVLKPGRCPCGRPNPMLHSVAGRSGEPITLPNGRIVNANLPSYIFKPLASLNVIRRYRFVQKSDNQLDLFLVVGESFRDEHRQIVEREMGRAFGNDLTIPIYEVPSLPHLANAKHRDYVWVA